MLPKSAFFRREMIRFKLGIVDGTVECTTGKIQGTNLAGKLNLGRGNSGG
jgi:hypothetical protein